MEPYTLHLNFLGIRGSPPDVVVYRRERKPAEAAEPSLGIFAYDLPENSDDLGRRRDYLVSFSPLADYSPIPLPAKAKVSLYLRGLLLGLRATCGAVLAPKDFRSCNDDFVRGVDFVLRMHPEGDELVTVQPYYLATARLFGVLVDFHFALREGVPFTRRIQQLSLSLRENNRRNLDYYADRQDKLHEWRRRFFDRLFPLSMPGATKPVAFDRDFTPLPARRLKPKTYIVGGTRESRNAFVGVRDSGPLHPIAECAPLLFLFREHDRDAARRLARALRGTEPGITFGGFERLFRAPLHISSAPVVLRDYSQEEMRQALAHVISQQGLRPLPVLVMPKDEDAYAIHKAVFTHAQVPTQVCTTETIGDDYALKWSVANIALQVFCKAGGQPWKVKPVNERALIIGISQSHRVTHVSGRHHIEKYFAFSVLTDSSGLFRSIEVIGQGNDESSYLGQLRHNLRALLAGNATDFRDVVVHTSFRLKRREMDAIAAVVREASNANRGCRFAIVKVNQKNRFFAVNRGLNSLVPYEGSYLRLGAREFLVWFEGVLPDNPTVSAALPGPTHLEFLKVSEDEAIGDEAILQDLVNLSGANWRGFNARSVPVSMFYCHLIADFLQDFQTRDLPLPDIRDLHPWFL